MKNKYCVISIDTPILDRRNLDFELNKTDKFEMMSMMMMLKDLGYDVHIFSADTLKEKKVLDGITIYFHDMIYDNWDLIHGSDFALMGAISGNVIGGKENKIKIAAKKSMYDFLYNYNKTVFMLNTDLTYMPINPNPRFFDIVQPKNPKYKLVLLTLSTDLDEYAKLINKIQVIDYHEVDIFPIYETMMVYDCNKEKNVCTVDDFFELEEDVVTNKDKDLIYAGIYRIPRIKNFKKYLFNNGDGNLTHCYFPAASHERIMSLCEDKSNIVLGDVVPRQDLPKLLETSHATIAMTEPRYEKTQYITFRLYESMTLDVINFIDYEADRNGIVLGKDHFNYVKSRKELFEKINIIKSDEKLKNKILAEQQTVIESITKESVLNKFKALVDKHT